MLKPDTSDRQVVAIVDAFSTGRYFAKELRVRGYHALHIRSGIKLTADLLRTFDAADFIAEIQHRGNLDNTLSQLRRFDVACVLAGTESGVELADYLSEALNLLTNGSRLSRARRDKFEMMEALRESGVKTPQYLKSDQISDILNWVSNHGITRTVLKPLSSASTDNVHICESDLEIRMAFSAIIDSQDRFGCVNKQVLVEEFLTGTEYVVNTVSRDKAHCVAEIWRCKKNIVKGQAANVCIYDLAELLPFNGEEQARLRDYVNHVLDALEIAHGPAHAEIMMTSNGPILIEIAARPMGSINPSAIDECLGMNPVQLTVEAYLNPSSFRRACTIPYSLRKFAYGVCLISKVEGTLKAIPLLKTLKSLESFFSVRLSVQVGGRIQRTVDFSTSPGGVYLIHSDLEVLKRDYEALRKLETSGFLLEGN